MFHFRRYTPNRQSAIAKSSHDREVLQVCDDDQAIATDRGEEDGVGLCSAAEKSSSRSPKRKKRRIPI